MLPGWGAKDESGNGRHEKGCRALFAAGQLFLSLLCSSSHRYAQTNNVVCDTCFYSGKTCFTKYKRLCTYWIFFLKTSRHTYTQISKWAWVKQIQAGLSLIWQTRQWAKLKLSVCLHERCPPWLMIKDYVPSIFFLVCRGNDLLRADFNTSLNVLLCAADCILLICCPARGPT